MNGLPPRLWRGEKPCGVEDQWRNGQDKPPDEPVPLDANGDPVCCDFPLPITCVDPFTIILEGEQFMLDWGDVEDLPGEWELCRTDELIWRSERTTTLGDTVEPVHANLKGSLAGGWSFYFGEDEDRVGPQWSTFATWDLTGYLLLAYFVDGDFWDPEEDVFGSIGPSTGELEHPWQIHTGQLVEMDDGLRWVQVSE